MGGHDGVGYEQGLRLNDEAEWAMTLKPEGDRSKCKAGEIQSGKSHAFYTRYLIYM